MREAERGFDAEALEDGDPGPAEGAGRGLVGGGAGEGASEEPCDGKNICLGVEAVAKLALDVDPEQNGGEAREREKYAYGDGDEGAMGGVHGGGGGDNGGECHRLIGGGREMMNVNLQSAEL